MFKKVVEAEKSVKAVAEKAANSFLDGYFFANKNYVNLTKYTDGKTTKFDAIIERENRILNVLGPNAAIHEGDVLDDGGNSYSVKEVVFNVPYQFADDKGKIRSGYTVTRTKYELKSEK